MEPVNLVYMTAGSKDEALTIGKSLVAKKLAACVNVIDQMNSIFEWKGEVQHDTEVILIAKTSESRVPELIEAVRTLQVAWDPPPAISVGLSNTSNSVPHENRPLISRVYCAMLMGAGLQMMIADPFDEKLRETIRIIEERDESTPVGRLYIKIHDRVAAMEEPTIEDVDMDDPEQAAIWKTIQILLNKVIYADSYLKA